MEDEEGGVAEESSVSVGVDYPGKAAPLVSVAAIAREVLDYVGKHPRVQVVVISGPEVKDVMDTDDINIKIISQARRAGYPGLASHVTRKTRDGFLSILVASFVTSQAIEIAVSKAISSDPNVKSALRELSEYPFHPHYIHMHFYNPISAFTIHSPIHPPTHPSPLFVPHPYPPILLLSP